MLKQWLLATGLVATFALSGCQTTKSDLSSSVTTANVAQLENRTWIATQIGNTPISTASTAHNIPSLQFDSATKRVSGADGCNRLMGSYEVKADKLNLSQMAGTRMACLDNAGLDASFNTALTQVTHYQVFNKTLKLLDRHGNLLIQLESAVQSR